MRGAWRFLKQTFSDWSEDKAPRLAAALAYYTMFSLAPLLIIAIGIAGLVFGDEAARGEIVTQVRGLVGQSGAEAIEAMIQNASRRDAGIAATLVGLGALLFGAAGLFGQLQDALNTIWEVKPKPRSGIVALIRERLMSFGIVIIVAFLLVASLLVSAFIAGASKYMSGVLPGSDAAWQVVELLVSVGVMSGVFALMFKYLPDAVISWRDVGVGALITAVLFTIGKFLIGLYLGRSSVSSAFGAGGSVVIVMVWVYYTAQIILFGAEFTQVWANERGSRVVPTPNAEPVTREARAQQGMTPRADRAEGDAAPPRASAGGRG